MQTEESYLHALRDSSVLDLKIAHVVLSDRVWGAARVALELAKEQRKVSLVWLAMNSDLLTSIEIPKGVNPLPLPVKVGSSWPGTIGTVAKLRSFVRASHTLNEANKEFRWDVVHFHLPNAYVVSLLASRQMNKVFTIHGRLFENGILRRFERQLAGLAIDYCPVSAISENAVSYAPQPSRVLVIHNGINPEEINSMLESGSKDELAGDARGPKLVFPGNLIRRKGQDLFIESLALIREAHPSVRAIFVGDGPDAGLLRNLAKEKGVDESVDFLGYMPNPFPVMRDADVVLSHLSLRWPFPSLVELEAMALGKPVVTRFTEEKYEVYGENVYYLKSEDPVSLAEAVEKALASRSEELADKRRVAASKMSWPSIALRYQRLYAESMVPRRSA